MPPRLFLSSWAAPLDATRRLLWAVTAAAVAGSLAAAAWDFDASKLLPPRLLPEVFAAAALSSSSSSLASFLPSSFSSSFFSSSRSLLLALASLAAFSLAAWRLGLLEREQAVFMRDLAVWKPLESWKMSTEDLVRHMRLSGLFSDPGSVDFIEKVMKGAGFAPATRLALSPGILKMKSPEKDDEPGSSSASVSRSLPTPPNHEDAVFESETIIFAVVDELLLKSGVAPEDVDVVVTTCSCFAPVPSLAASVVNRFGMRADVLTASLAGAGCGGNVVAIDLAARVLRSLPRTSKGRFAVVVCTENITNNWYTGNDKSMLLCNAIFRAGGAACLLTTGSGGGGKRGQKNKYRLVAAERTHLGRDDAAFRCMGQAFDPASGSLGVFLRKNVGEVAARAVRLNLERLGPRVLPFSELARVALSRAAGGVAGFFSDFSSSSSSTSPSADGDKAKSSKKPFKYYEPNFERSFAQVYPHAGGPAVLDAMQASLGLSDAKMQASRAVWSRFGNLSSASTLYATAFAESRPGGVRRGDRALVIGLGGCFKAGTLCWEAERDIREAHEAWA